MPATILPNMRSRRLELHGEKEVYDDNKRRENPHRNDVPYPTGPRDALNVVEVDDEGPEPIASSATIARRIRRAPKPSE